MITDMTVTERRVDVGLALLHASPLLVAIALAIAVGGPLGWIAFAFPVGPLIGRALRRQHESLRGVRSLLAFSIAAAIVVGGGWVVTRLGDLWPPLSYVFPLGLLAFLIGIVNVVMVVVSRTVRALRGQPFDYPWISRPLATLVGLAPGEVE